MTVDSFPPYEPRDLGDGLILRSATVADAEPLAEFNAMIHGGSAETPDLQAAIWTRDLLRGDHPTTSVSDFTIVEERGSGRIVSSCLLISQTWTYAGIPIGVGRPELVGTHPEYRGRGLIGKQFEVIHRRSAARGHLLQGLTGIPNYYRRFGYEPALITPPAAISYPSLIDDAPEDETEPLRFREATEDDLPFITAMSERAARRSLIAAVRDESIWRYEMTGRDPGSDYWHKLIVIESQQGHAVGALAYFCSHRDRSFGVVSDLIELAEGGKWYEAAQPILRYLRRCGEEEAVRGNARFRGLSFGLNPDHPLLFLTASSFPKRGAPFTWDVRVPDLPVFLLRIRPVLEGRLADSPLAEFSGDLGLTFYQSGVRLTFVVGRLVSIEPWKPETVWQADAAFPGQVFLSLLLGSRSVTDLERSFPDCRIHGDVPRALLETLFPVRPSVVWPIG